MNKSKRRRESRSRKNIFFHSKRKHEPVDLPINYANTNIQACTISLGEIQQNDDNTELKKCSDR